MPQEITGDRPASSDRRPATSGLLVAIIAIGGFCAAVFILEPQIVNPSIASCLLLIIGAPLLAIARLLDRRSRRRQLGELRDARRGGISLGNARRVRETVADLRLNLDQDDRLDPGRHTDAANRET